ncbi:uncharacterized protein L203_103811 [Cryptococcus depauperatus CBS 7841]|uniref:Magnesium transporter NIPA-domain-containing protein n=1 Tax=Cryptococcus depauperatus CBS 7841 TaxID=1295531 RepID=A0AAJ8M121_9TREE
MRGIPIFAAILVGLASSFVQSLGLTIQRKSHIQNDQLDPFNRRPTIRRPLWLIGFTIYMVSNIFSTIFQLDTLPIVILAPLGAVSLVFNALLARIILGDRFGVNWVIGTALVAGGAVIIAIFGVVPDEKHGLDELLVLLRRPTFVAFFSVVLVATCAVLITSHLTTFHVDASLKISTTASGSNTPLSYSPSDYASPHSPPPIPFRVTNARHSSDTHDRERAMGKTPINVNHMKLPFSVKRWKLWPLFSFSRSSQKRASKSLSSPSQAHTLVLCGLAFAASSGTLSGLCLVLAKAEKVKMSLQDFKLGYYLYASPALVCPLAFCFFNLSSIFGGLVFYNQFHQLSKAQIVLVSLGTAILLLGVWIVSSIQPEGVEVGTWVEDGSDSSSVMLWEEDELEPRKGATLMGGELSPEPEGVDDSHLDAEHDRLLAANHPISPLHHRSRFAPSLHFASSVLPRTRHSHSTSHQHYHRGPRYGTLIPDVGPAGAPTGFSIGLGAASPGFALRSASMSEHYYDHHIHLPCDGETRSGRHQNEGSLSLGATIQGENATMAAGNEFEADDNAAEAAVRSWDQRHSGANWWDIRSMFTRDRQIQLKK